MRLVRLVRLASALALAAAAPSQSAEQIVILGDSLSKEYEFSFRLDGFQNPASVRNWTEILDAERNDFFDLGSRVDIDLLFTEIFFRHRYNWAVPGSKIAQISAFLRGEIEFVDFYSGSDPTPFETVVNALGVFLTSNDFNVDDLDTQLRTSAERVVLLAGGNDADEVYREIYEADPSFDADAWIQSFLSEAEFIIDWVLTRNPSLEFVVVALPHVGITPNVKASHPTDPVKTARVTEVMRRLNGGLAALARDRGIAFADIFDPMLRLLAPAPLCLHGVPFVNDVPPPGSDPGDLGYAWLNGFASDGFHPNTNAQLLMANEIVRAFNQHYGAGIPELTATEMLHDWLGRDPDISFADWLACYGLPGAGPHDDRDRDGLPAAVEFGVGADPLRFDPWHLAINPTVVNGGPALEASFSLRLPGSGEVTVRAEESGDLATWTPLPAPAAGSDGRFRARLPIGPAHAFLRLSASLPLAN